MLKLLAILLFLTTLAQANQISVYGLGSKNQSMGNSASSLALDAFTQATNPAMMSYQQGILFGFSVQGAVTSFERITQVLTDTTTLGAAFNTTGDVNTRTPDMFNVALALKLPLNKNQSHPLNAGFFILTPVDKVMGIDTQDSFVPQYSLYQSDQQHLNMGLSFSYLLSDKFSLGMGGQIYFAQGVSTVFRLPAGGNSTARIRTDVRPGVAPIMGLTYNTGDTKISTVYWGKQDSRTQMDLNSAISLLGPTNLIFTGQSSVFYDPETFVLSIGRQDEKNAYSFSAHWERWGGFNSTQVSLGFQTFTGSFSQNLPNSPFHDVISLRTGFERKLSPSAALRLGYVYAPTPVPSQDGEVNFIDADKHQVGLGYSFLKLGEFLGSNSQLDMGLLVHYLVPKDVRKKSSQSIGYPGYKIGGMVYSYGVTLTTEL